jgi:hypothetical protein
MKKYTIVLLVVLVVIGIAIGIAVSKNQNGQGQNNNDQGCACPDDGNECTRDFCNQNDVCVHRAIPDCTSPG